MNRLRPYIGRVGRFLEDVPHWRLSTKLVVFMLIIALVPLTAVIVGNDLRVRAEHRESFAADLQRIARSTATAIDNRVAMRLRQVVAVSSTSAFRNIANNPTAITTQAADDARTSLYQLARIESTFEGALMVGLRGEVIATSGSPLSFTFADRPFFRDALAGKPASSDLEVQENGRRYLYYAAPLRNQQDVVTAILLVRVQDVDILELIDSDRGVWGADSFGVLWDRNGNRVRGGQGVFGDRADDDLARQVAEQRTGSIRVGRPDGALLLYSQPLKPPVSLTYTMVVPEAAEQETINGSTRLSFAVLALALAAVLAATFRLARLSTQPLKELQRVASVVRQGDLTARARVVTRDELGEVALSLNQMLDDLTVLVQTRDDRDRMQQQIMNLLGEVSSAASGDLTIEAHVTDGELGSVADAFNYMVGELRTIIASVNATTVAVSSSTGQILEASQRLVSSAGQQAEQIELTSQAVGEMSRSISRVSENSRASAEVAFQAREYARQGLDSVRATQQGMQRIRSQVQQTAKQIKRLGESSQEIGQIVQLISEMAEKTDLLALNAAIQAAMAGENGRGFAVVADEVRRLAERAASATKQIGMLVQSIQADTAQAVVAMESNTHEVVEGSRLADAAGQSLETIDSVVRQLAELIDAISQAADQQAQASVGIAQAMGEISKVTQSTSTGSRLTAESVGNLARQADQLRSSVAAFRLSRNEA